MAIIGLTDVSHYYGDNCVFKNVSFSIENDHRIGLIGHNGCGKTTILEIMAGSLIPSQGSVHRRKGLQTAYLQQSVEVRSRISLFDYVLSSHKRLRELTHLIKEQEQKLKCNHSPQNLKLLDDYHNEFTSLEGYALEPRVKMILQQLSFTESDWEREIDSFSGGKKTRIQLAATLLSPADLLLLDEPTNHLDIKMRDWLEKYINEINVPYIIVSHDRYFLEQTTSTIIAFENSTVVSYQGTYSFYETQYRQKFKQQLKAFESQQMYIDKTEDFIRKNIAGQKTKQAKSRRKMLAKLEKIEKPQAEKQLNLKIDSYKRSGNIVYSFSDLTFGFPGKTLAENITETAYYQDRIAVLGENGCGKTTFLQIMTGERQPIKGKITQGVGLSVGYYDQMHINLNNSLTVGQTISSKHTHWTRYDVLSYLAAYGFYEEDTEKSVGMLSGGEKARLYLGLLISTKPNLLIMDEPTNHLDIFMIKSLEEALSDYDGTIIFVSHDRYFINNVANRVWFIKDNTLTETNRWEELFLEVERKKKGNNDNLIFKKQERVKKQGKINPLLLEKKLKQIEDSEGLIALREKEVEDLQLLFCNENTMKDGEKVKELNYKINTLKSEIKNLNEKLTVMEEEYLQYLE